MMKIPSDSLPELREHFSVKITSAVMVDPTAVSTTAWQGGACCIPGACTDTSTTVPWSPLKSVPALNEHTCRQSNLAQCRGKQEGESRYSALSWSCEFLDDTTTTYCDKLAIDACARADEWTNTITGYTYGDDISAASPLIGNHSVLPIVIDENDYGRGLFSFEVSTLAVEEGDGQVGLKVLRAHGSAEPVELAWSLAPSPGQGEGPTLDDVTVAGGSLMFADGAKEGVITIGVVDDATPEQDESFTVTIKAITAGAHVYRATIVVTVGANDAAFGKISISADNQPSKDLTMTEVDDLVEYTFTIVRSGGAFGTVSALWSVHHHFRISPPRVLDGAASGFEMWFAF